MRFPLLSVRARASWRRPLRACFVDTFVWFVSSFVGLSLSSMLAFALAFASGAVLAAPAEAPRQPAFASGVAHAAPEPEVYPGTSPLALAGGVIHAHPDPAARTGASPALAVAVRERTPFPAKLIVGTLAGGWPPLERLDGEMLTGFSADYLRLLAGPDVLLEPRVFADMPSLLAAACAGQIDVVMSLARTPERERCLAFTAPYLTGATAFVTRAGNEGEATSSARLAHARMAVEKGYVLEKMLREHFPQAEILTYDSTQAALSAVVTGAADVYGGFAPAVVYQLSLDAFRDLRIAWQERLLVRTLRFATPVSKDVLRDRLNLELAGVRPADADRIRARWLHGAFAPAAAFIVSDAERAWLRALPPLKVGLDNDWSPFSFVGRSRLPEGMAQDYLDYLARTLGVTFQSVPVARWPDAVAAFRRGDLALLATSSHDDLGGAPAVFTQPLEAYPLVLVGRRDEPMPRGIADLAGRRIVLAPHTPDPAGLIAEARAVRAVRVPGLQAGLWMVERNQADVLVSNAATLDVPLGRDGALKVLGSLDVDDPTAFAVRADLAPLVPLIDRALDVMPPDEREQIRNHWVASTRAGAGGWSVNALRLLPVVIVFGVVLLVTLRGYVLLQREMRLRRRAEQTLAHQVELQNTMMATIPYPLGVRDLENGYIAVNRAYEQATGLARTRVIGRTGAAARTWGPNSEVVDAIYRRTLAEGSGQRVELVFDDSGGESRHGIFWTRLCSDARGAPFCVLGTMIDITDIRRTELRARESERLLSDVTRSLPAIVFRLRRSPDGAYTLPYLGGDTQRLLHDDAHRLRQSSALDLARVHPRDRARLFARLERSARRLEPVHGEFRYEGAAGLLWARAEFAPRREDDGAVIWSGYAVDASLEHARAAELARARDLAQAASSAKDEFLAMMSHEIRTPMNGVLGLVEVLERTPLDPDQAQMVDMVHESAGALLQILDDLLDFSKIQAGRLAIVAEPFDVRELVDHAVGLLAGRAHEKGLKMRVSVGAGVAATLVGDSVRLRQILFNLLGNAIKFTPQGEVSVCVSAAGECEARAGEPARQRLALSVADTGIGVAPEAQARLFEPFVQAESSTTRRFGGTGLGLTICRKLAALMGGTLELSSEPGRGTTLTLQIELPVEAQRGHANGLRGKRALVIADDTPVAAALMHFGAALGMTMTRAARADVEARHRGPGAPAPALVFACEADVSGLPDLGAPVVCLTETPKPTGYRVAENGVRVSTNPLSWRGLGAACALALAGLSAAPARSASEPGRGTPDRVAPDRSASGRSTLGRSTSGRSTSDRPVRGRGTSSLVAPDRDKELAAGRLILVAEDHPVNQELMRHQLALLGFACDVVNDGEEALAALRENRYGCLITDCHMPNVSGYDLARRVREIEHAQGAGRRLPILAITANTASENLRQCREAGMDDCLIKPTRGATLREHLARWVGVEGAHRPTHEPSTVEVEDPVPGVAGGHAGPLDLAHMIQVWGSEATVKSLLGSFVAAVRDDLDALPPLLESGDLVGLRGWHHRLAGAVGVLHYPALLARLDAFRGHMNSRTVEQLQEEGDDLIRACRAMLDDIEQQAALLD